MSAPRGLAARLARFAVLDDAVAERLWQRRPDLRPALAANLALGTAPWQAWYRPGLDAALAEALLWRADLTPAMVAHALGAGRETRKGPLTAALVRHRHQVMAELEGRALDGGLDLQLADLVVATSAHHPARAAAAAAASYKVARAWFLEDHHSVDDDTAYTVLVSASAGAAARSGRTDTARATDRRRRRRSQGPDPTEMLLAAALSERPALRDRLAACAQPELVRAAARAHPGAGAQHAIVAWLSGPRCDPRRDHEVANILLRQFSTTAEVAEALTGLVDPHRRRSTAPAALRCAGAELATTTHHGVVLDVLCSMIGPPEHWVLAATTLARNPGLNATDRSLLVISLRTPGARSMLGPCADAAIDLAATGQGALVPPRPRAGPNTKVGDAEAAERRLGSPRPPWPPEVAAAAPQAATTTCAELAALELDGPRARHSVEVLAAAGALLGEALGTDPSAWELALGLADEFPATMADLAELARLCAGAAQGAAPA